MVYRGNGAASRCNNYSPGGCVGQKGEETGDGEESTFTFKGD